MADTNIFESSHLLNQLGGDVEIAREIAQVFLDSLPEQLSAVEASVRAHDCIDLKKCTHKLKGSVSAVAPTFAAGTLQRLEDSHGDWPHAESLLTRTQEAMATLQGELRQFISG